MQQLNQPPSVPITEFMYRKASQRLIPLSGTFELSPVCNFDCKMCYVRKTAQEVAASPRPILTLEDWLRIARQARDEGLVYLLLTGGEPFLWPDFWPLYRQLVYMGFIISINTNGSMIDAAAVEQLKQLPPRRINITLYGANDDTYYKLCGVRNQFSRVDSAIMGLKEAGIEVKLNCSLTLHNQQDLDQMIAYAQARDLEMSVTTYMFPPIRKDADAVGVNDARFTPEDAARYRLRAYQLQNSPQNYYRLLCDIQKGRTLPLGLDESCEDPVDGKIRCRAGKASFWVTWDGWMTPCGLMPTPRVDAAALPFGQAWAEITRLAGQVRLSGLCEKCPSVGVCHPCAAMAIAETGTASGMPQYLCHTVQWMQKIAEEHLQTMFPDGCAEP